MTNRALAVLITGLVAVLAAPGGVQAGKTIVGRWAQSPSACKTEPVLIKPREISSEAADLICTFATVKRTGNTVRWTGHCYADGGTRRPDAGEDGVVEAVERKGVLRISGLGFAIEGLRRCN